MKNYLFITFAALLAGTNGYAQDLKPYQNPELSIEQRTEDLLSRLSTKQKIELMMDRSAAIDSLGIRRFNWWNEALHGVARAGEATVFPQTIGMAATFDEELVYRVFDVISDEARAKHHSVKNEDGFSRYEGLTMWTPNINIFRDPRWGRGQETYGEDPYLTMKMGLSVVRGLQGPADAKYAKLHACAKHFAVHSGPEWNRHSFDAYDISQRDLAETYLPAFEALVKEGGVKEVMCAYNRFEGAPCCGSNRLLVQILRNEWNYQGLVVTDCNAIRDFYTENAHQTHKDAAEASADAVLNGTDLECGSSYKALMTAVDKGLIDDKQLDVSVRRLLKARFELGEMDDDKLVEWSRISPDVIGSEEHNQLALQTARSTMTLLQNNNSLLPLSLKGQKIAVMGPNANDKVMQWANYNGVPNHTVTVLDGIRSALGYDVIYEKGCECAGDVVLQSLWEKCSFEGKTGFRATYWNNKEFSGQSANVVQMANPLQLCSAGATVFAPGVELNDFSAIYESSFVSDSDQEVIFKFMIAGETQLYINGEMPQSLRSSTAGRRNEYKLKAKAGQKYDVLVKFVHGRGDALINFDIVLQKPVDIASSLQKVKDAEVVIFVAGLSPSLEGEEMKVSYPGFRGGDRTDIELPEMQRKVLAALKAAGKKVVYVNCSGSAVALEPETKSCDAILQAWYPGQEGGTAVADVIFGKYNPAGRLPVTFYKNLSQLSGFEDYSMKGRTYRFMDETPLFPFGYGLSYSTFEYGKADIKGKGDKRSITIPVTNTSNVDGDEVVQVYITKVGDKDGAKKTLRSYKRVHIKAGETTNVKLDIDDKAFEFFNPSTMKMQTMPGQYIVHYGKSSKDEDLSKIKYRLK